MFVQFEVYALNINKIHCVWITRQNQIMCRYGSAKNFTDIKIFEDKKGTYDTLTVELQKITQKINNMLRGITEEKPPQCDASTETYSVPVAGPVDGKPLRRVGGAAIDLSPENLDAAVAKWDALIEQKTEQKK